MGEAIKKKVSGCVTDRQRQLSGYVSVSVIDRDRYLDMWKRDRDSYPAVLETDTDPGLETRSMRTIRVCLRMISTIPGVPLSVCDTKPNPGNISQNDTLLLCYCIVSRLGINSSYLVLNFC